MELPQIHHEAANQNLRLGVIEMSDDLGSKGIGSGLTIVLVNTKLTVVELCGWSVCWVAPIKCRQLTMYQDRIWDAFRARRILPAFISGGMTKAIDGWDLQEVYCA